VQELVHGLDRRRRIHLQCADNVADQVRLLRVRREWEKK
jgi:hypothetical protein